jgi:hypothetical protein
MKNIKKILLSTLILSGLQFVLLGCLVGPGGGYRGGGRVGSGPWFQDGPWMDGGRGGVAHVVIHPPGYRR